MMLCTVVKPFSQKTYCDLSQQECNKGLVTVSHTKSCATRNPPALYFILNVSMMVYYIFRVNKEQCVFGHTKLYVRAMLPDEE